MKIHLNSKQGLFEVEKYGRNSITLSTKHDMFSVPVDDFKSFAGGNWNFNVSKEEMDTFLSIVQPEKYKKQFELENEIISLAKRIDMIDQLKASMSTPVVEEVTEDTDYEYADEEAEYNSYMQEIANEEARRTPEEWNDRLSKKDNEIDSLRKKLQDIASKVYSQNLDFTHFQNHNGIKFIIQTNHDETEFRFRWDPYGFVDNFHSSISHIYRENGWYTKNGGWIKIIDDNVILYAKSGDYGVYDDAIATECAKKVFPGKNIHSFAGRQWNDGLEEKFFPLPF
jgi:hypothetical protein